MIQAIDGTKTSLPININLGLETLREGDGIRVTTKRGNIYELVNLKITNKTLIGRNLRNGHKTILPFEVIRKLEKDQAFMAAICLLLFGTIAVGAMSGMFNPRVGVWGSYYKAN